MVLGISDLENVNPLLSAVTNKIHLSSLTTKFSQLKINPTVIDIQETCVRNIINKTRKNPEKLHSAYAGLFLVDDESAIFLICSQKEIFFFKRMKVTEKISATFALDTSITLGSKNSDNKIYSNNDSYQGQDNFEASDELKHIAISNMASKQIADDHSYKNEGENIESEDLITDIFKYIEVWEYNWANLPIEELFVFGWNDSDLLIKHLSHLIQLPIKKIQLNTMFPNIDTFNQTDIKYFTALFGLLLRE
jgi:hypothetical protein